MCGIAGYLGPRELSDEHVRATLAIMGRRGPDHRASVHRRRPDGSHVHLLHSRLDIIDPDPRSNQPFERDGLTITFNGEIYDYVEKRTELERLGVTFKTKSDTEVLVAALRHWSTPKRALDRLEGMWAFACYDELDGTLWLSRDRFGEKPLYVLQDPTGFYFASEIKFLATLVGRPLRVEQRQLLRYLVNGYRSLYKRRETFFEDVREVTPGTCLALAPGRLPVETRYWTPHFEQDFTMTAPEARERTRELIVRAMHLRLRSDAPLAFCMSGGIDSNTLISVAKNIHDFDVHGFTIVNTDERYAEANLVDHAVATQHLRHTSVPTRSPDGLQSVRELVRHHDAPIFTISYFIHWLLMGAMREAGYRVSISGTGADELFSGYIDHHLAYLAETHETDAGDNHFRGWKRDVAPTVRNPFLTNPRYLVDDRQRRDHLYLDCHEIAGYLTKPFAEAFQEEQYTDDVLRNRMANELFAEAVPVILHEDDLNSMYHSIENRSPFLDRRLVEFAHTIPTPLLMRDGLAKVVLRDAMRGIVPDRILDSRKKVGFNAPIADVVDVQCPNIRAELLAPSPIFELVDRTKIQTLLDADLLPNSRSKFVFNFICAKLFLEEHAR